MEIESCGDGSGTNDDGGCSNDGIGFDGGGCSEDSEGGSDGDGRSDGESDDDCGSDSDGGSDGDGGSDSDGDGGNDGDEGTGGIPARIACGQSWPHRLLNVYLARGRCCKDCCLMKYNELPRKRADTMCKLDKTSRKAVVLGMLAVIRDKSGSRNTFQYRLDWCSPVCRDAFCAVIGTSYCTLKHWMQQVCSDSDVEPHPHGNCGRSPHNTLSRLDKNRVVSFIRNYATIHALPDPGRLQGAVRDFVLRVARP